MNHMYKKNKYFNIIKGSKRNYEQFQQMKTKFIQNSLKPFFNSSISYNPKKCPKCSEVMDTFAINIRYHRCPHCDFKLSNIKIGLGGRLALIPLIGVGIVGIVNIFRKKEE